MGYIRFHALNAALKQKPLSIKEPKQKRSELFGVNVFNDTSMREYMTKETFVALKEAVNLGKKIDRKTADQVASAMKNWAINRGVTHYTHWFQPLTGSTAEKHDAFFDLDSSGIALESFNGSKLVQQEPDASSFPSGGIRNTFEARGYTAWDPSSPAFIIGTTLCIPTIFVSYTGESLDNKVPLIKALTAIDQAATDVAKYFDKNINKVIATLGIEQEYFLVDKALANSRPDIQMAGRMLLGHQPAKGQQLDDHYFGSIPDRALAYMRDLEIESIRLGIPLKTRHNEVAPNQFELAPLFEEASLAIDHNSLLMDLMQKIAKKHHFTVLFHEKPFAGVNGSGKHNNWSLSTDTGVNLLSPGKTPKSNLQFLTFFVNTIKAIHDYADLLRASIATAGNDIRLGANEAPPSIISVFIGKHLTEVLDELENVSDGRLTPEEKTELKLNVVGKIPEILLDNTDRNRTTPMAFTGNKFEFRAVGSSANCGKSMTVLNTIVAHQLQKFKKEVDYLIEVKEMKKDDAIFNVLRELIKESKDIRFEGDGYSEEWIENARNRGLKNTSNTPQALKYQITDDSIALFESNQIMSKLEIEARYEVELEDYVKKIQIESRILGDISQNHIIPTAVTYQNKLIKNVRGHKKIFGSLHKEYSSEQIKLIQQISKYISSIVTDVELMTEARKSANKLESIEHKADAYCNKVIPYFAKIRYACDKLELLVDDEIWPLTKYRELLFTK
ncbi:MAG: glutamine synthetase III [Chitinophagales bacterium]|nr:glutamine synthetase III [Chitinophagales bacterium]